MRRIGLCVVALILVGGCASRKSSLLLERQARGPIAEESAVAQAILRRLEPAQQSLTKSEVTVTVQVAPLEYLRDLFSNKKIFGNFAGRNPYFPEHLVFHVTVANHSDRKIRISPSEFVMIDDQGNQYSPIGVDYVTAFAESRQPVATTTRGLLENANPGYFGLSVPVGKMFVGKPQWRLALLQQSGLQSGYLYPDIVHDGLLAFWTPSVDATKLRLLIANIKIDFNANDEPQHVLDFPFEFTIAKP